MAKTLTLKQETEALLLKVTELIKQLKADDEGEKIFGVGEIVEEQAWHEY